MTLVYHITDKWFHETFITILRYSLKKQPVCILGLEPKKDLRHGKRTYFEYTNRLKYKLQLLYLVV